ncbi:MAG: hypothetical protein EZS28_003265 [Streblomastix strix]|uniref:Nucleolar protein 9 n=1 Tax=Streblomastix strix TaxID=222440 RepID=A0A5J4X1V4_9EUKA|nr:MAG: hypothetical protein EZS28_003265 [Streblomastix strix]
MKKFSDDSDDYTSISKKSAIANEKKTIELVRTYFSGIDEMIDSNQIQEEDRNVFLDNVFSEINEKEARYSCDIYCSRVIEKILDMSKLKHLLQFFGNIVQETRTVICHQNGSHILEKVIILVFRYSQSEVESQEKEINQDQEIPSLKDSIQSLLGYIRDYVWNVISDVYSSHVIRTLIIALGGCEAQIEQKKNYGKQSSNLASEIVSVRPIQFPALFEQIIRYILSIPHLRLQLVETLCDTYASLVFQDLIVTCSSVNGSALNKKIIKKKDNSQLQNLDENSSSSDQTLSDNIFDLATLTSKIFGNSLNISPKLPLKKKQPKLKSNQPKKKNKESKKKHSKKEQLIQKDEDEDKQNISDEDQQQEEEIDEQDEQNIDISSINIDSLNTPIYQLLINSIGSRVVECVIRCCLQLRGQSPNTESKQQKKKFSASEDSITTQSTITGQLQPLLRLIFDSQRFSLTLVPLSIHPIANHVVIALLDTVGQGDPFLATECIDIMIPHINSILQGRIYDGYNQDEDKRMKQDSDTEKSVDESEMIVMNAGVVYSVVHLCEIQKYKQGEIIKSLRQTLCNIEEFKQDKVSNQDELNKEEKKKDKKEKQKQVEQQEDENMDDLIIKKKKRKRKQENNDEQQIEEQENVSIKRKRRRLDDNEDEDDEQEKKDPNNIIKDKDNQDIKSKTLIPKSNQTHNQHHIFAPYVFFLHLLQLGLVPYNNLINAEDSMKELFTQLQQQDQQQQQIKKGIFDNGHILPFSASYYGVQICCAFTRFDIRYTQLFINSVASLPSSCVVSLAVHPIASRFVQAYLSSSCISHKRKTQWLNYLCRQINPTEGNNEKIKKSGKDQQQDSEQSSQQNKPQTYISLLALDKYGSHTVECAFQIANINMKEQICRCLADDSRLLMQNQIGRIVYTHLDINTFRHNSSDWRKKIEKEAKTLDWVKQISQTKKIEPK